MMMMTTTGRASRRSSIRGAAVQLRRRTVWRLFDVGVPVIVVDTGWGRRRRQLHVVLAEPRSGFPRWRETIDHLTEYRSAGPGFHALRSSSDHRQQAALRFDDHAEAARFHARPFFESVSKSVRDN